MIFTSKIIKKCLKVIFKDKVYKSKPRLVRPSVTFNNLINNCLKLVKWY